MFERYKWSGKPLLKKIQLISFLVVYLTFPFMIQMISAKPGEQVPSTNIYIFFFFIVGIGFYVVVLAWASERILRKQSEKFAGRRVLVGTNDSGSGRTEDYEFIVADMFPFKVQAEFVKEGVRRIEEKHSEFALIENKKKEEEVSNHE